MSVAPIIDIQGLTKAFNGRAVVDHIDMTVGRGEIVGFLGPNGSGKTTTIRMICGLLRPDAGEGECLGYDIRTQADLIKLEVGYMTQRFSLYEDLTIRENLDFVARLYDLTPRAHHVDETLEQLGLTNRQNQLAGALSGGWKQRLALAACIMHKPKLLLLDEPTAGVDPKARREFWDEIHDLAGKGLTVLVSTHYMDEAERCHRIVYIAYGSVVARGTVPEVIEESGLHTFVVTNGDSTALAKRLRGEPGIEQVASFGNDLHVVGTDERLLERSVRQAIAGTSAKAAPDATTLEDVFIRLMSQSADNYDGTGEKNRALTATDAPALAGSAKSGAAKLRSFSWSRIMAIMAKEVIQMRRDRLTFAMIIGIPVLQLVLFGYAINTDPKRLPTAVIVADNGPIARSIVTAMQISDYFEVDPEAITEATARRKLDRGEVTFILTVPPGFQRQFVRGERPQLLLEADATDPAATSNGLASLDRIITSAISPYTTGSLNALAPGDLPIDVVTHLLYNPEGITAYNIVPGLLGTILTMTTILMTALALTREVERGTIENLMAMPARPYEIMIGKIVPYIGFGFAQVAVILVAAALLFAIPMQGPMSVLLGATLLFITANVTLGYTFSTIARNQMQAMQMTFFFFLPSILLSGFMFPFRGMPDWAQVIGEVIPLTHYLRIVRAVMLKGVGLTDIVASLWPLVAFWVVVAAIALVRYRRTLD